MSRGLQHGPYGPRRGDAIPLKPGSPGELIRRAPRRRGLSLEVTADRIGKSKGWLSMIENGRLELDSLRAIVALAAVLRVPVAELTDVPVCQGCPRRPR